MFKRDINKTPAQRANKAVLNIIARLGGCGFLIYFLIQILTVPEAERPDPTTTTIIAIVFIVAAVVLIFITVMDGINGLKTGRFKASTYEELDLAEYRERQAETGCTCEEEEQQELEARTDEQPDADEGDEADPGADSEKED
jgi:hypothetical protein